MKNYIYILTLILAIFITGCENDDIETSDLNYINFSSDSFTAGVDPGSTTSVDITVYTTNKSSSDRSFGLVVDVANSTAAAGSYTVPDAVIVPGGSNKGTFTVTLSDINLGIGINELVINFAAQEGLAINENMTLSYTQNCTELSGTLELTLDAYGSETSWEILDSEGGLVTEGGTYSGQSSATEALTLCQGRDYTLVLKDSYGDGFCCAYGNGSYILTVGGNEISSGSGDIGAELRIDFSL